MGDVIDLFGRRPPSPARAGAPPRARSRARFFFDLSCPFTYFAAERVERAFDDVLWVPASGDVVRGAPPARDPLTAAGLRRAAEQRARMLRMPLVWPERFPAPVPVAMRVAAYAAQSSRGGAFVVAATRLAFCGGYDLDDPEILMEAADAAGLGLDTCLEAAADESRDAAIDVAGRALLAAGADRLPALRLGRALYWGERRAGDALRAVRLARAAEA